MNDLSIISGGGMVVLYCATDCGGSSVICLMRAHRAFRSFTWRIVVIFSWHPSSVTCLMIAVDRRLPGICFGCWMCFMWGILRGWGIALGDLWSRVAAHWRSCCSWSGQRSCICSLVGLFTSWPFRLKCYLADNWKSLIITEDYCIHSMPFVPSKRTSHKNNRTADSMDIPAWYDLNFALSHLANGMSVPVSLH